MPGEKIVISGNFLIDSEAKMQQATAGITGKIGRDPVCGMNIDEDRARSEGNYLEYRGQTYFFCDPKEREDFRKEPERYLKLSPGQGVMPPSRTKVKAVVDHTSHGAMERTATDGVENGSLHNHNGMKTAMPKDPESSSLSPGIVPMEGEKARVPLLPVSRNPVQMMPGPADGMSGPGLPGPASMPSQMPGGAFPPPVGAPVKMLPGQGTGMAMPGSPGAVTLPEPRTEGPGRSTSRPPRRRGVAPFDGAVEPGVQEGPSAPLPKTSGTISPGAGPARTEQQLKSTGSGQNHD